LSRRETQFEVVDNRVGSLARLASGRLYRREKKKIPKRRKEKKEVEKCRSGI